MRDTNREAVLVANGITKSYGGAYALQEVDAAFYAGEIHALLGENGAGKSTLVKSIIGVVVPDSGNLTGPVFDQGDIAMVFQELSSIPEMSVLDNLVLSSHNKRGLILRYGKFLAKANSALDAAGLAGLDLSTPVSLLSLAQRQLLEIARGLMSDARLLILDEPTATLSDVEIDRVHKVVRSLARTGTSVVYITHRLGEVFQLADRVTIMRKGRVVSSGKTADYQMENIVTHMLGKSHKPEKKAVVPLQDPEREGLVCENFSLSRGFNEVALRVPRGQVTAVFGQIGSGADAVVRALAGLEPESSGRVNLDGEHLTLRSRPASQAEGIAYISPDRVQEGVFLSASVITNISSGALPEMGSFGFIDKAKEKKLAKKLAVTVALDPERINDQAQAFSGGNQQKIAIARALATRPGVLLLNEPTRGVDIGARAEIYQSIRDLSAQGVVVLAYSSDIVEIRELADVVVTMYRGQIIGKHAVDEVTDEQLMTEILSGEK